MQCHGLFLYAEVEQIMFQIFIILGVVNMKKFLSGVCFTLVIIAAVMVAKTIIPAHAQDDIRATATDETTETTTDTMTAETTEDETETTATTTSSKKSGGKRSSTTTTAPSNDEVEPTYFDEPDEGASSQAPSTDEVEAEAQEAYTAPVGEISWVWLQEANGMAYMQNHPFTDGSGRHLTFEEATAQCGGVSQAEFWQISEGILIETHTCVVFSQKRKGEFISLHKVYDPDTGIVTNF